MQCDAIIFDKDGTLIDFDAFWVDVSVNAIRAVLLEVGRADLPTEPFLSAFGVHGGVTDIDGVLCKGTYGQLGEAVHRILLENGTQYPKESVVRLLTDSFNASTEFGRILPTSPRLAETLTELKRRGKRLAVVTTDNGEITEKCLRELGIFDLFDKIYTDDGILPTKPNPFCALDFCRFTGISPNRTVMVGDTLTDIQFARNANISVIGIAKTEKSKSILLPCADAVIDDPSHIFEVLD